MSKLRSISTSVWSDVWFEELTPDQKLIWIYLITNDKTNMLGIYEASSKKISFETGIKKNDVDNALKQFENDGKVLYRHSRVILVNFLKHQNFNTNMKKSAIDVYNNLPNELKINGLDIDKSNPLESFETLSNHLGMVRKVEVEVEYEVEREVEEEVKYESNIISSKDENERDLKNQYIFLFDEFWKKYDKKVDREKCLKKWMKLKQSEIEQIFQNIEKYVESTPDKQYRKNPLTYLNSKSFENEIINKSIVGNSNNGKPSLFERHVAKFNEYQQHVKENNPFAFPRDKNTRL